MRQTTNDTTYSMALLFNWHLVHSKTAERRNRLASFGNLPIFLQIRISIRATTYRELYFFRETKNKRKTNKFELQDFQRTYPSHVPSGHASRHSRHGYEPRKTS